MIASEATQRRVASIALAATMPSGFGPRRVAEYDVTAAELADIKQRLLAWADEIDAAQD